MESMQLCTAIVALDGERKRASFASERARVCVVWHLLLREEKETAAAQSHLAGPAGLMILIVFLMRSSTSRYVLDFIPS
ncbi:uncharacterized protein LAESUDRAFT_731437 [Laetiporus sulphureus 93-53]|uniref:Uncharacterized protein n=1 Tax=Laetiporus sulphureus 93-53 TaxID=1314785 RepID=A0A165BKG6_9APHY|nr:uncharacterized protein LAESUDRAFT_731437 [Laetiporus sulphureus 93-53]KZT01220.1 hypothetical protein LAESUDRAFT_731437 [Laetiporus sulphureus 93-53]